jgi:SAM-dependent methyltransferase
VSAQYTTDDNLAKRIAIHSYSVCETPFTEWYNSHVEVPPGARLLDIGCGNAYRWKESDTLVAQCSEIVLADSSPGMLDAARSNVADVAGQWRFEVADVCSLPFDNDSFQIVMANHMLYHAEDVNHAVAEIARVLTPGGALYATTNGLNHMWQLVEWLAGSELETLSLLRDHSRSFGVENGPEILGRHFSNVDYWPREDYLSVKEVQPVLDYVSSIEPAHTPQVRATLDELRQRLELELREHGAIRIDKHGGLFKACQSRR